MDTRRTPDERAALATAAMTLDEKIGLLHGPMALPAFSPESRPTPPLPADAIPAAGYVPGLPRLGIPALYETDASLGVANPGGIRHGDVATALPAGLVLASAFDPTLAYRAGALVGSEASAKGFNVLLAGGMNLARDPRNGRNFEYLGEDPLLSGRLAGAYVRGTQDQHVISTIKHFALNANETNRFTLDARIDRAALRESDLLAFEMAIEGGHPGAVMCAYNLVNGEYACGNRWLLDTVLKADWHYPGWVMSDWGAVHAVSYAVAGLDQQSGQQLDAEDFFDGPLRKAVADGSVKPARIDDMVHRILRSMFAVGIVEHPPVKLTIDYPRHAELALEIARKGIVMLKNDGALLPLTDGAAKIAVIGGNARLGVLSGGGSSQVTPFAGNAPHGASGTIGGQLYDPSPPYEALRTALPAADLRYDSGEFPARSAAVAARADVAIVFVTQHQQEGVDVPDLELPSGQNALIDAVATANPHTLVVLETGNPVVMPWITKVPAVLASWYSGQEGGRAIAEIVSGAVNPSGRLPISFPRNEADLVRPALPNLGSEPGSAVHVDYSEGALVGYRGYPASGNEPAFSFGHGLSYTHFDYGDLKVTGGRRLTVKFSVVNSGSRAGGDVPQVYLTSAAGREVLRLVGFQRVELAPGEHRIIEVNVDPRLLGTFDEEKGVWKIQRGLYRIRIGRSARELDVGGEAGVAGYRGRKPLQ